MIRTGPFKLRNAELKAFGSILHFAFERRVQNFMGPLRERAGLGGTASARTHAKIQACDAVYETCSKGSNRLKGLREFDC